MLEPQTLGFLKAAAEAASEKQGEDILVVDVTDVTSLTDGFVFVGATSHVHVKTLEDAVRERLKTEGADLKRTDGRRGYPWRVLDYGEIIVHVLEKATRDFYSIERLWAHGKTIEWQKPVKEKPKKTSKKKTVKKAVKKKKAVKTKKTKAAKKPARKKTSTKKKK